MSKVASTYASAPDAPGCALSGAMHSIAPPRVSGACLRVIATEGPHR